jgi:hypothetical protein
MQSSRQGFTPPLVGQAENGPPCNFVIKDSTLIVIVIKGINHCEIIICFQHSRNILAARDLKMIAVCKQL